MFKMKYTNITNITRPPMYGSQQLNPISGENTLSPSVINMRDSKLRTIGNMFERVSSGVSCNNCGGFKTGF